MNKLGNNEQNNEVPVLSRLNSLKLVSYHSKKIK